MCDVSSLRSEKVGLPRFPEAFARFLPTSTLSSYDSLRNPIVIATVVSFDSAFDELSGVILARNPDKEPLESIIKPYLGRWERRSDTLGAIGF